MELVKAASEVKESKTELHNFKDIKPETDITQEKAREYWDKKFSDMEAENNPTREDSKEKSENVPSQEVPKEKSEDIPTQEASEEKIEQTVDKYIENLKDNSEVPDTIPDKPFEVSELEQTDSEKMREAFEKIKNKLIKQWEDKFDRPWPTYKEDVRIVDKDGELKQIRKAGDRYDIHHIQPLCLGGKNEVENITPLSADVHFDHKGVHAPESPYDKLSKMLGGNEQ